MTDLIDREKLTIICYTGTEGRDDTFDEGVRWMLEQIDKAPTVDAIPVEWINDWYDKYQYAEVGDLLNDWAERKERGTL